MVMVYIDISLTLQTYSYLLLLQLNRFIEVEVNSVLYFRMDLLVSFCFCFFL